MKIRSTKPNFHGFLNSMVRHFYLDAIQNLVKNGPQVIALLGPRQCGKTTLAKQFIRGQKNIHFFDLEDPTDLAKLQNPKLALQDLKGLVVIDEIQRLPEVFPLLRVLADRKPLKTKFLILGSASRDLINQSSETLAGRISYIEVTPFSNAETLSTERLWIRGGFPKSFLAKNNSSSFKWRQDYISTFLERDLPQLGINIPSLQLRRFWTMLSHYHGQTWNSSEFARSFGTADTTVRKYLDILTGTFMIRQIQPWYQNIGKRVVKAPKVYLRDSGLLHVLLGVKTKQDLFSHPKLGASWEGFVIESLAHAFQINQEECYYWGVHGQSELDLFLPHHKKPIGFEVKFTEKPLITKSMHSAIKDLNLDKLYVVHPGNDNFIMDEKISAVSLKEAQSLNLLR